MQIVANVRIRSVHSQILVFACANSEIRKKICKKYMLFLYKVMLNYNNARRGDFIEVKECFPNVKQVFL